VRLLQAVQLRLLLPMLRRRLLPALLMAHQRVQQQQQWERELRHFHVKRQQLHQLQQQMMFQQLQQRQLMINLQLRLSGMQQQRHVAW
jgi:hypothetical protein